MFRKHTQEGDEAEGRVVGTDVAKADKAPKARAKANTAASSLEVVTEI